MTVALLALALTLGYGKSDSVAGRIFSADAALYDLANSIAPLPPDDQIELIAIDEPSMAQIGRWPWARSIHAAMIERLTAAGALVIGLDVLMSEKSESTSS